MKRKSPRPKVVVRVVSVLAAGLALLASTFLTAAPAAAGGGCTYPGGGSLCIWIGPIYTNSAINVYFNRNQHSSNDYVRFRWINPDGRATGWTGWTRVPANSTRQGYWPTWIGPGWNVGQMEVDPAAGGNNYILSVGAWA